MNLTMDRVVELPWSRSDEESKRFQKILLVVLAIALVLAVIIPNLTVEKPDRKKAEELPPRFAKLILEKKTPPPPPPPKKVEKKKPEKKPVKKKVKPKKKVVKKKKVIQPDPDRARKVAEKSGLLAFQDDLADLRTSVSDQVLKSSSLQKGGNQAAKTTRSIITSKNATSGSGGINTSRLSRDTGGRNLASRSVTQVSSKLKAKKTSVKRSGGSRKASRSIEELQLVFDKNKGGIYSIYNRALRKDPSLQGKVVLKLTIAPSGRVTQCKVVSSELNNPALERKLVARVKLFKFGARNVDTMVTTYPIEFLPS